MTHTLIGHTLQEVVKIAKSEPAARMQGGFSVYHMSDGTLDWFPTGHAVVMLDAAGDFTKDHGATLLARYRTVNHGKSWHKLDTTEAN